MGGCKDKFLEGRNKRHLNLKRFFMSIRSFPTLWTSLSVLLRCSLHCCGGTQEEAAVGKGLELHGQIWMEQVRLQHQ